MPDTSDSIPALPLDAQGILELAARSMFQLFSTVSQGMFLVDLRGRIVWVNEGYQRFFPDLGITSVDQFVGRTVEEVIPNTGMRRVLETGQAVLIDLLTNKAGTFVVSRIPLRDDVGKVIGAIGIVLFDHPETTLQPLISKFALLQRDLDEARRELAAQRSQQLRGAGSGDRRTKYTFASFVGSSPAATEVKRQARRAAQSASPVLLLGETGTGKELLAHAIHAASQRASGPFVGVNIAAVPDTLLEAEFFGVAPGAYTGADRKGRDGKFKLADGGTLFLDEIGDMPSSLQAKLLRALQEGEIEPLGSNQLVPFDVRVIAATSRDLSALVREGRFREDLFYRLHVLPVRVPPLRERPGDIPALVEVLGEEIALRNGIAPPELLPDAMALLAAQPWRGNIRELRNVLEQAAMRSDAHSIDAEMLRALLREAGVEPAAPVNQTAMATGPAVPDSLLRPLAVQVEQDLKAGVRKVLRFGRDASIADGNYFILGGQLAFVAEVGEAFKAPNGENDARLRVIYSNGTESNLLRRSLQRALYKDDTGRRLTDPNMGPLFSDEVEPEDIESGTIYVLRSKSDHPFVAERRQLVHKIGVTGGKVETRIAGAENQPTYLLAGVEIVATYKLHNVNRVKLEGLFHRVFGAAQLDLTIEDRFGRPVKPREWFLVPLHVVDEVVQRLVEGTLTGVVYDPQLARLVTSERLT